jgi:hypothetical protein
VGGGAGGNLIAAGINPVSVVHVIAVQDQRIPRLVVECDLGGAGPGGPGSFAFWTLFARVAEKENA